MKPADCSSFGYKIRETAEGWTWVTFDLCGQVQESGSAPEKAVAAACVIRALARAASEAETARQAA